MEMKSWLKAALLVTLAPGLAQAEVRGLYGTNCLEGNGASAIKDLLLRGQTMETVQTVYSDLHCESPSYDFSFSGPFEYNVVSGFFDYEYASIKLQVLDQNVVQQFNEAELCGIKDWTIGAPREVSGLDCGGQLIPSIGTKAYDLIHENVSESDPSIQLGLISELQDGLSSDARPTKTEDLIYYPK
ncbi:MAG: hypothetical protein V4655_14850 [Bdellovibrionota bacterium]